jgi:hypothetical protein
MNLSSQELKFLITIVATYVELVDQRAAYWRGDVNSKVFTDILDERKEAYQLECKLREIQAAPKTHTIVVKMPDRLVDRN